MGLLSRHKGFIVFVIVLLATASFSLCYYFFLSPPLRSPSEKLILIKRGTPLKSISALLEEEGIIRNRHAFTLLATVLKGKGDVKAGEYEFHTPLRPLDVLDTLIRGQVKRHFVTIVEGYTVAQIAQLLDELNIVGKEVFLKTASSPAFVTSLGVLDPSAKAMSWSLEGYLFPDTYHFFREMEAEEVIRIMVHQFKKTIGQELTDQSPLLGMSPRQALVLASIIEKETPLPEEKPLVSAVFHNRLRLRMPLQSDPTVIYGVKQFSGNLTREHLIRPTPYNTYVMQGLPPTPICNPGKDSILAALNPAPVPFLYFVSKNDGSHFFSSDFEEHNRAVWKYQKYPRKK